MPLLTSNTKIEIKYYGMQGIVCNGTLNLRGMEESLTKDEAEELFNNAQDVLFGPEEKK
jgi:hypothetical protein